MANHDVPEGRHYDGDRPPGGQAIAGAAERNRGANCYPIGYYNLTWNDFLKIVHKAMGQPNRKIINIPKWSFQLLGCICARCIGIKT